MSNLFTELKRRNVFRVGFAYVVMAWLLAQITDLVIDNVGAPEWVMKIIFLVLAIGFPIALFFAWAFEMTPEGIKREHEVDRSESITPQTGRKLDRMIGAAIAIAVVFLLVDRFTGPQLDQPAPKESAPAATGGQMVSIAVLPFVNMSSDPEQEYFSDGISEEILNQLVRVDGLSVTSRTSAFSYKGQGLSIDEIARDLGVDHILEGSVRKERNNVRITAQLIDASTDRHLWSATYDRKLTSIFAIQDEISGSIVEALRETLGVDIRKATTASIPTTNVDAYTSYLKARELFYSRDPLALRQSLEIYQQAIERDPGFARAYEGLAAVYTVISAYKPAEGYEVVTREESKRESIAAASKALEIDATLSMPHAVLGLNYSRDNDHEESMRELDRAIELDSRESTGWMWKGMQLTRLGYLEESIKYYKEAYRVDPDTGINSDHLGFTLLAMGKKEEALFFLNKALDKGREIYLVVFMHNIAIGDFQAARLAALHIFDGHELLPYLMPIFEGRNDASEHQRLVDRFWKQLAILKPDTVWAYQGGPLLHAAMGNFDKTTETFVDSSAAAIRVWHPALADYRKSDQFKVYLRQTRIEEYWRKHGWPDMCRPLGDDDFECD
ncbi:MAG: tetratricopeptide repeat protein [Proteobacteria bacterium]|nr:tetratricopeptide repeat protein [Pseudomonadota bacterium]